MSSGLNEWNGLGHLGQDSELKQTQAGMAILRFSIGCNETFKKGEEWQERCEWVDCVVMGKRATSLAQYLVKGKQVFVSGKLRKSSWEKDGVRRSKTEVIVRDVILCGSRGEQRPAQGRGGQAPTQNQNDFGDFGGDDDVPF